MHLLGGFLLVALTTERCSCFMITRNDIKKLPNMSSSHLFASDSKDPELKGVNGMKGYYVRPSRAIEKGGGFFIPGLEGGKVRLLSAIVILVFFAINSSSLQRPSLPVSISTVTGVLAAIFLFSQGVLETLPPSDFSASQLSASTSFLTVLQSNSASTIVSKLAEKIVETVPSVKYLVVLDDSLDNSSNVIYEIGSVSQSLLVLKDQSSTHPDDSFFSYSTSEAIQIFPWLQTISSLLNQQFVTLVRPEGSSQIWIIGTGNDLTKDQIYLKALLSVPQP